MMKKIFILFNVSVLFLLLFPLLSSCKNNKAESYFNEALDLIDLNFDLNDEQFNKVISLLDKSIECDKTMWKSYRQKLQVYISKGMYDEMEEVYNLYLSNGNELNVSSYFSYGCLLHSMGKKDKASSIFTNIYEDNKERIKDKTFYQDEESDFVATIFSGIITGDIKDIPPIKDFVDPNDPQATMDAYDALSQEEKLQGIFNDFELRYKESPDELLLSYAGF